MDGGTRGGGSRLPAACGACRCRGRGVRGRLSPGSLRCKYSERKYFNRTPAQDVELELQAALVQRGLALTQRTEDEQTTTHLTSRDIPTYPFPNSSDSIRHGPGVFLRCECFPPDLVSSSIFCPIYPEDDERGIRLRGPPGELYPPPSRIMRRARTYYTSMAVAFYFAVVIGRYGSTLDVPQCLFLGRKRQI